MDLLRSFTWGEVGIGVAVVLGIVGLVWLLSKLPVGSGSSSSSSSSSKSGLGLTVGADGVGADLGVTDTVGIDLKDGSITVGSGPIKWDLDGSGPKFKF